MASAETRVILEIDGVPAITAMEVTPPKKAHTPVEYQPLNQPMPELIRGSAKIEELTFKHARAVSQVGRDLVQWLDDFVEGIAVVRRNFRLITLDEAGRNPVETWELQDCVPTSYGPDSASNTGTGVASFTFGLRPTNSRLISGTRPRVVGG